MKKLEGKIALVTGGTTGIGLAAARRFAAEGATVFITGTSAAHLDDARNAVGGRAEAIRSDAGSRADLEALAHELRRRDLRLDVLFLNAGIGRFGPIAELSEADFDDSIRLNVKGPWLALKLLAPLMRPRGAIVATTSVNGRIGMPGSSAYAASKAALRALVRVAAVELAPNGIRVNAVAPGPIETPFHDKLAFAPEARKQFAASLEERIPLHRFGRADEIAAAVLFLACDESSYLTGAEIVVDGGMTVV
ncbi:MAG TPA: SDR family oxidoreductase [Polyangia bacterium]|nr:SDR family oxidoreductase [Polyangia bacterium]